MDVPHDNRWEQCHLSSVAKIKRSMNCVAERQPIGRFRRLVTTPRQGRSKFLNGVAVVTDIAMQYTEKMNWKLRGQSLRALRRGVSVLELILVVPILLILLLAVIEFGQILASLKQVSLASRVGAKVASELPMLPATGSPFPMDVAAAVQNQLLSNGMTYSRIVLQHDSGGMPNCLSTDGNPCPGTAPTTALPGTAFGTYVRVTVYVEMTQLSPNLLSTLGLTTVGKVIENTTTYIYEN